MKLLHRLLGDDHSATAIEYGLITLAAITAMRGLDGQLKSTFNTSSLSMAAS